MLLNMDLIYTLCLISGVCLLTNAQFPTLLEDLANTSAPVGGSASFDCELTETIYSIVWSKKSPNHIWISRNGIVFDDVSSSKYAVKRDEGEPSSSLEIANLELADSGVYECSYEYGTPIELGSATLTVLEAEPFPSCSFVEVPSTVNDVVVDLTCSWPSAQPDTPSKLYRGGENVSPNVILTDRLIARQSLQQLSQTSEFECRWESPTTTQTATCSFPQSSAPGIKLGVDPFVNDVALNQTARFICVTEFEPPTTDQDIAYSWSVIRNGTVVDLGERQKGFMKQSMRILNVETIDSGSVVQCSATRSGIDGDEVTIGYGMINTQPVTTTTTATTEVPGVTTKSQTEGPKSNSQEPQSGSMSLSTTIMVVMAVLVVVILILTLLLIFTARSKLKRSNTMKFRRKIIAAQLAEDNMHEGRNTNPDIICAHSSTLPLYTVPDTLVKSNTVDGCARYPLKHYLPRRQSYGETMITETNFARQQSAHASENYPNPYEDIELDAINDTKRFRSKSHTVSRLNGFQLSDVDSHQAKSSTDSPRRYRGMKPANSMSTLYSKPEKPPRNQPRDKSPMSRKSWDLSRSIEDLCNSVNADSRSVKSFTTSICERDGYACFEGDYDEIEGETMTSEYMDMNPVVGVTDTTILSVDVGLESESCVDNGPVYAQIRR